MRKVLFISALCCVVIANGCEKKKLVQKESTTITQFAKKKSGDPSSFTKGIETKFNSVNKIESATKKKLTNFGKSNKMPSVLTPDLISLNKALDKKEFIGTAVAEFSNGIVDIPSFAFDYENDIAALNRLYKKHNLDKLINENMPPFEIASALAVYTHNFLKDGREPTKEEFWNLTGPSAETITNLMEEQNIGGTSEHYAALMVQLALSCGLTARIVSMHTIDDSGVLLTHDICELYMPPQRKWVVFDPYYKATFYFRDEKPLSAYEIRNIMLDNIVKVITPVILADDFTDVISVREKLIPRYEYLYCWRMNDFLSKSPRGKSMSWQQLFSSHLVWEDEFSIVKNGQFDKLDKFTNKDDNNFPLNGVQYVAHEISDFYWSVNQVHIDVERIEAEKLRIYIDTVTPNFDYYLISVVGQETIKKQIKSGVVDVDILDGEIDISSVNKFGVKGSPASFTIGFQ